MLLLLDETRFSQFHTQYALLHTLKSRYTYHLLVALHRTLPISERSGAFCLSIARYSRAFWSCSTACHNEK